VAGLPPSVPPSPYSTPPFRCNNGGRLAAVPPGPRRRHGCGVRRGGNGDVHTAAAHGDAPAVGRLDRRGQTPAARCRGRDGAATATGRQRGGGALRRGAGVRRWCTPYPRARGRRRAALEVGRGEMAPPPPPLPRMSQRVRRRRRRRRRMAAAAGSGPTGRRGGGNGGRGSRPRRRHPCARRRVATQAVGSPRHRVSRRAAAAAGGVVWEQRPPCRCRGCRRRRRPAGGRCAAARVRLSPSSAAPPSAVAPLTAVARGRLAKGTRRLQVAAPAQTAPGTSRCSRRRACEACYAGVRGGAGWQERGAGAATTVVERSGPRRRQCAGAPAARGRRKTGGRAGRVGGRADGRLVSPPPRTERGATRRGGCGGAPTAGPWRARGSAAGVGRNGVCGRGGARRSQSGHTSAEEGAAAQRGGPRRRKRRWRCGWGGRGS